MKIYVCYEQNGFGLSADCNEIDPLTVKTNHNIAVEWVDEQLHEAKENGFVPESPDEIECELLKNNINIYVSKGNEKEGYVSYEIVVREFEIETEDSNQC